jgi:hypothetical protein
MGLKFEKFENLNFSVLIPNTLTLEVLCLALLCSELLRGFRTELCREEEKEGRG